MQAYEGYLENGRFFPLGVQTNISGRRKVILTVIDEPLEENGMTAHQKSWKKFLEGIKRCEESLGDEFDKAMNERVNFIRELDL
jgi:predicted secreted Zn-dependent protease